MYPKLRDILCFSILLGSALVSSQDLGPLDPQKVHDMIQDTTKTKEQKIAMAKEMVQSLPTDQKEKVLAVITDLITQAANGVKDMGHNAGTKKIEEIKKVKEVKKRSASGGHHNHNANNTVDVASGQSNESLEDVNDSLPNISL